MRAVENLHNWRIGLPDDVQLELEKLVKKRKLVAGETLYSSGDIAAFGYQIISGQIQICNYTSEGGEIILANYYPGDCFGDIGLISGGMRGNYANARTDTVINILTKLDYDIVVKRHPEVSIAMNNLLSHRLQMMYVMVEEAYLLPLYERLARVLIRLAISHGFSSTENEKTIFDVSQEALGQMVGATRQSVGRELNKMKKEKYIDIDYNKLTILNLSKLTERFGYLLSHDSIVATY